jgi:hypothetical protein
VADPKTYLLKFDLDEFETQVSRVSQTYTGFGTAVRDVINSVSGDLSTLQQDATSVSSTLAGLTPQIDQSVQATNRQLGSTAKGLDDLSRHSESIANNMTRLSGMKLEGLVGGGGAAGQSKASAEAQAAIAKADVAVEVSSFAKKESKAAEKKVGFVKRALRKQIEGLGNLIKSEAEGAKSAIGGVLSHIPGGVASGGIMGGLIRAMVLGYSESDRLRAEAGEVKNIFEATGESLYSKESKRATEWFTKFQKDAQWFYDISRQESQGVARSLVEAGFKSIPLAKEYNKELSKAAENTASLSIYMDKHFNQQTGTSMKNIIQITTDFGDSMDVASDKYMRLGFMAQRSGMGIEKFVNAIMSGASAMRQYGIDVEDVGEMMGQIQGYYKSMGLGDQYAGNRAAQAIQGMGSALQSLSPGMKQLIIEQEFPELGLTGEDAIQAFEEGATRAGKEGMNDFARRSFAFLGEWSSRETKGNRAGAIQTLQANNLQNLVATVVVDTKELLREKNGISKLTKEETKHLEDALKTESERVSEMQKLHRNLTRNISTIGKGLLKILVGILGVLTVGIRGIPDVVRAALSPKESALSELGKIGIRQSLLFDHIGTGVKEVIDGAEGMKGKLGRQFREIYAPLKLMVPEGKKGGKEEESTGKSQVDRLLRRLENELGDIIGKERAQDFLEGFGKTASPVGGALNTLQGEMERAASGGPTAYMQNMEGLRQEAASGAASPLQGNAISKSTDVASLQQNQQTMNEKMQQTVVVSGDKLFQMRMQYEESLVIG